MSRHQLGLLVALVLPLQGMPLLAQTAPTLRPLTSDAQLRQQFRADFLQGCNSGRTQGVRNQQAYCNCLANAYVSRYDGATLQALTQLAGRAGAVGPPLVDLMMTPERRACTSRS